MKVLFLTEGVTTPSSRFRVGQFLDAFAARGVEATVRSGYDRRYNEIVKTRAGGPYKAACRVKKALHGLEAAPYDVVFLQRPAIPQTPLPEVLLHAINPRIVLDFDDNLVIGAHGDTDPMRERTLRHACEIAQQIIVGNAYLGELAARPQKTTIIPTVIDTGRYVPRRREDERGEIVLGWMGTAGNFQYLDPIWPDIRALLDRDPRLKVRLVSNAINPLFSHERVEQFPWSSEAEIALLRSFDIGLMPLKDSKSSRGKCGFKMIQYMAVGRPVVASAVGANREIFAGSGAGELLEEGESWAMGIERLLSDERWRERGERGRAHVVAHYSIEGVLPRYMEIFEACARA